MQVNSYNNYSQNQASFGSTQILPVWVENIKMKQPVKAWFSRLSNIDHIDIAAMEEVKKGWKFQNGVMFAKDIYSGFKRGCLTHGLELDSSESLYNRLLCLSSSTIVQDAFKLEFLQSSPSSSSKADPNKRKFLGSGTGQIFGLSCVAQEAGLQRLCLTSTMQAKGFYSRLGMQSQKGTLRGERKLEFDKNCLVNFIKQQKEKFQAPEIDWEWLNLWKQVA